MKDGITGLTEEEVKIRREQYGKNELKEEKKETIFHKILHVLSEPMFLLLLVAAVIYFILGEPTDGVIMLVFVLAIIAIDVVQEWKTDQTLRALKDLSEPQVTVIRSGEENVIASSSLVPGDMMMIYEGIKIPADGFVVRNQGLRVDESSLTGEAEGQWKVCKGEGTTDAYFRDDYCYAGTMVLQGTAIVEVEKTGNQTEYGKIGSHLSEVKEELTPLQKQTRGLVKTCAMIAFLLFILVTIFTYFNLSDHTLKERIIESILSGVTLAMAMIPEEFPVVLTVFLSMGAFRLAKKNALVRRLPSVETLGAISTLCVDKTGTITMNQMAVKETYVASGSKEEFLTVMGLACMIDTYDPMEKAMFSYCKESGISKEALTEGELLKIYPFNHEKKMMGHIWKKGSSTFLAAKGSLEGILSYSDLEEETRKEVQKKMQEMSAAGLRVIAVAAKKTEGELPEEFPEHITFLGLVGLADPPRDTVASDIETCKKAGIKVIMITGDNGITASSIARKIGMENTEHIITGAMLEEMSDEELKEKVRDTSIFSRVIPEHKMRIVKALKDNGEIVAMTGDGVNDAPALKYADIGIAMGKRGSEVAREAADLILLDDNFTTIVETIKDGRRIYDNIRKAIGYIFTIHIPIALASLLAPFLGINPSALLLLPLHIVLLELVIDPTCSIVLERQPAETSIMNRSPRKKKESILTRGILIKSILQGLVIFTASFGTYFFILNENVAHATLARSMGLCILVFANFFLVQVNSSDTDSLITSTKRLVKDKMMWFASIGTFLLVFLTFYTPLHSYLKLYPLTITEFVTAIFIALLSVIWYELVKAILRRKKLKF